HRRLSSLIRLNELNDHQLLDVKGLTEAFRAGEYARMLRSLRRKLYCIDRVLDLYLRGTLRTAEGSPAPQHVPLGEQNALRVASAPPAHPPPSSAKASRANPPLRRRTRQPDEPFIPSDRQREVLEALFEKARTLDSLSAHLDVDRSTLYRD